MPPEEQVSPQREQEIRDKMLFRIKQWKDEGFDVSNIEDIIRNDRDLRKARSSFIIFKEKVRALKDIELELSMLDTKGFDARVNELKAKLRNVDDLDYTKETFQGLKAALDARPRTIIAAKGPDRDALLAKVKDWAGTGYDVARIENFVRNEPDIAKVHSTIEAIEKKVNVLDKVRLALNQMEKDGFEPEVRRLERMIKQMERTDIIWNDLYALRAKIKDRKKEVVQAEASSRPVKIKVKKVVTAPEAEKEEAVEEPTQIVQFRRIDIYVQLIQNILIANKRLLTLDTLRLAQRALKNEFPKIMFFLVQKDFKIKSMMPDHPDSYKALEAFLNRLHATLAGLLGEDGAKDRLRTPAKQFITTHINEILASGLDDYFPMFLIIDDEELPETKVHVEVGESDDWGEVVGKINAWLDEGYKIDRLVQAMEGNRELALALFRKTEEEIFWLKELERDVHELEKKLGPRKELEDIRKKLIYPERIVEVEDDILSLQMMVDLGDGAGDDLI